MQERGLQHAAALPEQPDRVGTEPTCSLRILQPFARYLAGLGRPVDAWLRAHGLSPAELAERDRRVSHTRLDALLHEAVRLSGDAAIGVRAVACVQPGDFDVLEYATTNCATVGEAIRLAARFIALMHDGVAMELDVAAPLAALRARPAPGMPYEPAALEFLFASLLAYGSRSLGRRTRPLRVELAHASPDDTTAYEEIFREVRFGADENIMWIHAAALELPHSAPDSSLLQILTSHADALLSQLPSRPRGVAERARAAIAEELPRGQPAAERIARKLGISLRTLHRRLAEEGTSHGELVDDVRRAQALLHLASPRFSIGEISFLLGFAHPNAFHKAFKRWTRMTPMQYRERHTPAPPSAERGTMG